MIDERFLQIVKEHKWMLYKVIHTYCQDEEDRKDLEQEILIQLWTAMKSYDPNYKMSTWIYRIALNVAVSFYRSGQKRESRKSDAVFYLEDQTGTAVPYEEESKILREFIDQLDNLNKEVMILYLDDLSYKEIAEIVGISESNVGTKINRIKKRLRTFFGELKQSSNGIG